MDFKLREGDSIRLLAPFADMLNHSIEAEQCHTYDPSSGSLSVLAGKNYDVGDQVRLSSFSTLLAEMLTYNSSLRFLSITDLSQTIAFHVFMDLSYPIILTKATILFLRLIPWRRLSS
jgi:hypothetical protein